MGIQQFPVQLLTINSSGFIFFSEHANGGNGKQRQGGPKKKNKNKNKNKTNLGSTPLAKPKAVETQTSLIVPDVVNTRITVGVESEDQGFREMTLYCSKNI